LIGRYSATSARTGPAPASPCEKRAEGRRERRALQHAQRPACIGARAGARREDRLAQVATVEFGIRERDAAEAAAARERVQRRTVEAEVRLDAAQLRPARRDAQVDALGATPRAEQALARPVGEPAGRAGDHHVRGRHASRAERRVQPGDRLRRKPPDLQVAP
jgi:hypothetical protein